MWSRDWWEGEDHRAFERVKQGLVAFQNTLRRPNRRLETRETDWFRDAAERQVADRSAQSALSRVRCTVLFRVVSCCVKFRGEARFESAERPRLFSQNESKRERERERERDPRVLCSNVRRASRDPFKRSVPYGPGCPALAPLLAHCGPELFDASKLPWTEL